MPPKPKLRRKLLLRRLLACLTILSLLLCGATVGLWVRSYWRFDSITHISGPPNIRVLQVRSSFGELGGEILPSDFPRPGWYRSWDEKPRDSTFKTYVGQHQRSCQGVSLFGFGYFDQDIQGLRLIYFPHWFLALLFAILPAIRLRSILRNRRRYETDKNVCPTLCPACGYDLRATPDRCPECGKEVIHESHESARMNANPDS